VKTLLLLFCFAISAFAQGTKSSPNQAPPEKIDAAALIKEILNTAPKTPREMMGLLKIRAADGKLREVPIKWLIRPFENQWQDIYQTPEPGPIPAETLIVVHREGMTNHYDFKRAGKPVAEIATNVFVAFGTSDFWAGDFGLEFLHWPNPKHVKTEMRHSRPCYVIETINPHPELGGYARVLSWIDTEHGGLIRADGYTADGKLWKEFQLKDFKRVEGRWQLKAVTIRNDQTDSNTRLEFDLELKD
jgi:hypothetical protein